MIGVFGGTFDPPHLGHVHLIKTLLERFKFTKLYLVPNSQNPLKTVGPRISAENRLLLLKAAIDGLDPRIEILDWEILQKQPSYTIDTVNRLLIHHPKNLTLIIGDDLFSQLDHWKSIRELLSKTDWIIVKRRTKNVENPQQLLHKIGINDSRFIDENRIAYCQDLRSINFCEIGALPFSSTEIRNQLGDMWKKNSLEIPPQGIQRSVWLLIKEKQLYSVG